MDKSDYQEPTDKTASRTLGAAPVSAIVDSSKPRGSFAKWVATICIALLGFLLFSSVVNYRITSPAPTPAVSKPAAVIAEPLRTIPPVIPGQASSPSEGERPGVVVGRTAEKPVVSPSQSPSATWEMPTLTLPALASRPEPTAPQSPESPVNNAKASPNNAVAAAKSAVRSNSTPTALPKSTIRETVSPILPYVEAVDPNTARTPAERAELEKQAAARQAALSNAYSNPSVSPSTKAAAPNKSNGVREIVTPIPPYVEVIDPSVAALSRPRTQAPSATQVVGTSSQARATSPGSLESNVPPACRGLTDLVLRQCQRCEPLGFFARSLCKEQVRKEYCAGRYGKDDACVLEGNARGF